MDVHSVRSLDDKDPESQSIVIPVGRNSLIPIVSDVMDHDHDPDTNLEQDSKYSRQISFNSKTYSKKPSRGTSNDEGSLPPRSQRGNSRNSIIINTNIYINQVMINNPSEDVSGS